MASFYAELHVEGRMYVVQRCRFSTHQPTGARGRPSAKVRQGPLELTLNVDADEFLTTWGAAAHAPKNGHVTFFDLGAKSARETIAFTGGHLVHLREAFAPNADGKIAYYAELLITAAQFELLAGAPANPAAIRPAHGSPPLAGAVLVAAETVVAETLTQRIVWALGRTLDVGLSWPVLLVNFLLMSHPAQAPGLPAPPPASDKDKLRLAALERRHARGEVLDREEMAEYLVLLAKVRGIHLTTLYDSLADQLKAHTLRHLVPDFKKIELAGLRNESIGEFDGVHLGERVFIEDKSARGLGTINPKTGLPGLTPAQWAVRQIYTPTYKRINALKIAKYTYPEPAPPIGDIRGFRRLHFRIEANTPEVRVAVEDEVNRLRKEFPDWDFTTQYGN